MIKHDIHIHTYLSDCADKNAYIADYIDAAKELSIGFLGFTDHAWDENVKGASHWYEPQNYRRLGARRDEIKSISQGEIKILLGAEGEYAKEILTVTENALEFVDYIIVPHSHTHMKGIVLPEDCDTPQKHGEYLVKSFISLCNHKNRDLFFGIAHPMYPIGKNIEQTEEIYSFISDEMILECAMAAKENGVALELNLSVAKNVFNGGKAETCYHKFLSQCKNVGCEFFLGSDAHSITAFKQRHSEQPDLVKYFGFDDLDFTIAKLHKSTV